MLLYVCVFVFVYCCVCICICVLLCVYLYLCIVVCVFVFVYCCVCICIHLLSDCRHNSPLPRRHVLLCGTGAEKTSHEVESFSEDDDDVLVNDDYDEIIPEINSF